MTIGPLTGVVWFDALFPLGLGVGFGPTGEGEFTPVEAAVLAFAMPGLQHRDSDAWILEDVPITAEHLAAVKRSLQAKYEAWQRDYWEGRKGRKVLRYGRLFP